MQIDLLSGWKYREGIDGEEYGIPDDAVDIDLPADLLRRKNRNTAVTTIRWRLCFIVIFLRSANANALRSN